MTISSLAMIVVIIRFENLIRVAPAAARNSLTMISMRNLLHLVARAAHLHEVRVALQVGVQVAAPGVLQEVLPEGRAAPLEVLLEVLLGVQMVVDLQAEVRVAVHLVVALQVEVQVAVHPVVALPARVPVVAPQVAHPRERVPLVDYSRIQTPSPASRHPIVSSTLRALSCSFTRSGVPEMTRATRTYHPPSMSMAIPATIARSPQVKSG